MVDDQTDPQTAELKTTGSSEAYVAGDKPAALPAEAKVVAGEPNSNPAQQPAVAPTPVRQPPKSDPLEAPAARSGVLSEDIGKILQEVKLPERRDSQTVAEKRPHASLTSTPLQDAIAKESLNAGQRPASGKYSATQNVLAGISVGPQAPLLQETVANPPEVPPVLTPHEAERGAESVAAVHTLKNDLQSVVREKKLSLVKAVSLEEDRRASGKVPEEESAGTMQRSRRTFGIIFSIVLLCVVGGGAIFGVYTIQQQHSGQVAIPNTSSLLFAETTVLLSLDEQSPSNLKRTLGEGRSASTGTLGSITRILPIVSAEAQASVDESGSASARGSGATRPATFAELMQALGAHAPDGLIRALSDDFFFGIHTVDKNAPVLVIPVTSYDHAFAGMIAWEATMNADLAPAFTAVPMLTTDQNGLPTRRTFQDLVMRNYDVRALKDDAGTIELYYSFPTQNILIIAESPYSFAEVLSRLQAGRKL
ncbi:hypothetical protein A2851_05325 [Candidatus Kaiserbacteria bacterium RIFCSPHIGHO2_01_FULL_53_29]|uniref:Uncharacterized protein n=1 Tax=Candidatus Kaiserbacteria bacterium RIFCSPHIGHO2_01_FULL_53_29 TaxID=1798480 RepID=A0A1F6CTH0_9BACT|nr:MAG: hypothetical protein A2851_05325 [Candidatus Kaiserbacteria bacterium RIFCSPHIGHO2_01_FULL_53_29]